MNFKVTSALIGFTFAIGLVAGVGIISPTKALAEEDCSLDYAEGSR